MSIVVRQDGQSEMENRGGAAGKRKRAHHDLAEGAFAEDLVDLIRLLLLKRRRLGEQRLCDRERHSGAREEGGWIGGSSARTKRGEVSEDGRTPADRGREGGVESGSVESRGLCTVQAALGPASGAARLFDRVASCVANVGGGGRGLVSGGARTMAGRGRAQSAGGEDPGLPADMTDKWSLHAQSWLLDTARNVGNGLAGPQSCSAARRRSLCSP